VNHLIALGGIVLIGLSPIWVALAHVSPVTATLFRCVYALPALLFIWYFGRRRDRRPRAARALAFGSGFLLAVDLTTWHQSIALIGAGLATVLANTQVVFVAFLAWLFHREQPTRAALQAIPVVLLGAVCISGLGRVDAFGTAPIAGALLGMASGLLYALFLLSFRASNRMLAPPAGPLFDTTAGAVLATLALGPFLPGFDLTVTWPSHAYLMALAFGSQVFGWLIITYVLPRLAALETSLMMLLQPLIAFVVAALLLGERISAIQGFGIFLVVGGVGYVSLRGAIRYTQEASWTSDSTISKPRVSSSNA